MLYDNISAYDTETTGFRRFEGDLIFSYSLTDVYTGVTKILRLPVPDYTEWLKDLEYANFKPLETDFWNKVYSKHDNFKRLQDYFDNTDIVKTAHNAKFDHGFTRAMGIIVPEETVWHCTMIASQHLMNLAPSHALDEQAYYIYKYPMDQDSEVSSLTRSLRAKQSMADKKAKHERRIFKSCYQSVPIPLMSRYQRADGERAALLYRAMMPKLFGQPKQWEDYLVDIALLQATIRQEELGIRLDDRQNKKLLEHIQSEHDEAQSRIDAYVRKHYPKVFPNGLNPKSTIQLRKLVMDCMGYELTARSKAGGLKVDSTVLGQLLEQSNDQVFDDILKCVAYRTGISTLRSYTELAHPSTRKIHANHKTNEARTGRQSVSEPNLQNIAKEKSDSRYPIPARKCFATDPGYVLWMPDYSGIELRLIADVSHEQEYILTMLRQHPEGYENTHDLSAHVIYREQWDLVNEHIKSPNGLPKPEWMLKAYDVLQKWDDPENLRKQMRNGVKSYVFGRAYGGRLEKTGVGLLTLTYEQKIAADERFGKRFPKVSYFTENLQREIKLRGYVETTFGRKLYVEKAKSHKGANYIIQGTAAGMLKRAEVRIDSYARENCGGLLKEVVTVHDEAILAVHRSLLPYAGYVANDIAKMMEVHSEINTPMEAEFKQTTTVWSAAKEIKFPPPEDWRFGEFNIFDVGLQSCF